MRHLHLLETDSAAPWCGPCRALAPALGGAAKTYGGRMKVVKVNVGEAQELADGAFLMASPALGYWMHPGWFFFTAFGGLNLFQSAFTGFCPLELVLRRCGVPSAGDRCGCRGR